jgi:tetratricopeptide (TPR) repeat protein
MHIPPVHISNTAAEQVDAAANVHLLRGLALLEAIGCFDEAITLRQQLPLAANPWFRYGLTAGWLNRGDALTRLGGPGQLVEALRSFDEALAHLRELPMHESPLFVQRLAIAWLNRGVALLAHNTPRTAAQAVADFDKAIAAAENFARLDPAAAPSLLAGAWQNRSNALIRLDPPQAGIAHEAARKALSFTAAHQQIDFAAAEIAFKSFHTLCQALARLIAEARESDATRDTLLHEATDVVEAGLALARHWQTRGEHRFDEAVADLFRFGCRAYQTHQPHFLTEFVLENLDPTQSDATFATHLPMHTSAAEALWHALGAAHQRCFEKLNTAEFDATLEHFRNLRVTEERLLALRRKMASLKPG